MKYDTSNYKVVIGYGVGEYYELHKTQIKQIVKLDYLCDRKWDNTTQKEYDGIAVIPREQMRSMGKILIVIMVCNKWQQESIKNNLSDIDADVLCISEIIVEEKAITGKELKEKYISGKYKDEWENVIWFDETISDNIKIYFRGKHNVLTIERDVAITQLQILFGNYGSCRIGSRTELLGDNFFVSGASLIIGKDCLLAADVTIRTHDGHHIFDLSTKKRLNVPQDIVIGNQVWIAYGATLLGGARIGDGSVVGTGSVTSSEFGDHLIIAGSPAKVIREHICWSKDSEEQCNHQKFGECISQTALRYL